MDRSLRIRAADRRSPGSAHASCPHPGDERRELPAQGQQAAAPQTPFLVAPICEGGFRSGLNAPRKAGRRPTLQPPRKSLKAKHPLPTKWSTFSPPQWSSFTPPLTNRTWELSGENEASASETL